MRVIWSEAALLHLAAIQQYISQTSPLYAAGVIERIWHRGGQLAQFPDSGREVPEYRQPDIREIIQGSYRVIYRRRSDVIEVLAVIHGARRLPPLR
jgi:plasmid stabilization system protein ParE